MLRFIFLYQKKQKNRTFKSPDKIFLSSFIPLNDIREIRNKYNKAEVIQNHAGSSDTIKEFIHSINEEQSNSDLYKSYLEFVDKILFNQILKKKILQKNIETLLLNHLQYYLV